MNMYDLTQTNLHLPDSYGGNLGKQRLLRLRISRILTGLLALFVLALIFTTAGWDDDPGPRIRGSRSFSISASWLPWGCASLPRHVPRSAAFTGKAFRTATTTTMYFTAPPIKITGRCR